MKTLKRSQSSSELNNIAVSPMRLKRDLTIRVGDESVASPARSSIKRLNIWERLSDPASFTGVYAERFRDGGSINSSAHDGNIRDLSEITRPGFRTSSHVKTGKGWEPGQHANSGMLCDTPATRRAPESPKSAFLNSSLSISSSSSPRSSVRSRTSSPASFMLHRSISSNSVRSNRSEYTSFPSSPKHVPPVSPINNRRTLRRSTSVQNVRDFLTL